MPEEETPASASGLDWEALADSLFGGDGSGSQDLGPATGEEEGGADPAEPSNEEPTVPTMFTEDEINSRAERRAQELLSQIAQNADSRASEERIRSLIATGTDEEVAAAVRQAAQIEAQRERENTFAATVRNEAVDAYAGHLVDAIMTPDWVQSLTDADAARIDPDKFQDDASLFREIISLNAEKLASGRTESDFQEAVKAGVQAELNKRTGQRLSVPSASSVPAGGEPDGFSGLRGESRMDAIWAEAISGIADR